MELKRTPEDNGGNINSGNYGDSGYYDGSNFDSGSNYDGGNSYYESNDGMNTFNQTSYNQGPYGDSYYGNQNYNNPMSTEQSVNPYQQYGYGRTDLNDGFYDEPAEGAGTDMMDPAMKTMGVAMGVGGIASGFSDSTGMGSDRSYGSSNHNSRYHRHYHRHYGARSTTAGAVSAAMINEVLANAYLYMFIALLITGITALLVASSPTLMQTIFGMGRVSLFIILIAEFGLCIACTTSMQRDNFWLSATLFACFAIVNGITFSVIFWVFTMGSICRVFFITAIVFALMASYGAITKKDLTGWGPILLFSLIGIIIGSAINFFVGSTTADYAITIIGIIVFMAYTAYDVNKIKKMSRMNTGLSTGVLGMYGAMELYLDFINLFIRLLRLMGKRK